MKKYQLITSHSPLRDKSDFLDLYHSSMKLTNTPTSQSGFDEWFARCITQGVILIASEESSADDTMELIAHLYGIMDEDEKADWSPEAAEDMVADQRRYEIKQGITPHEYDARDFFETIAELIAQDKENED